MIFTKLHTVDMYSCHFLAVKSVIEKRMTVTQCYVGGQNATNYGLEPHGYAMESR